MRTKIIPLCFMLLFTHSAFANFLPFKSTLDPEFTNNMTEEEFNRIVDKSVNLYKPMAVPFGGSLVAYKYWRSNNIDASSRQENGTWSMSLYGGLARHPLMNADGYSLIVCHELGHHFGGFPFYPPNAASSRSSSIEGQADLFSTQHCARRVWQDEKQKNAAARTTVSPSAKSNCDHIWKTTDEQNLCYRISNAAQVLGTMLASMYKEPQPTVGLWDENIVTEMINRHPSPQCRVDTYFLGALCSIAPYTNQIPGRLHPSGQNSLEVENLNTPYYCAASAGRIDGTRPSCWFAPKLTFSPLTLKSWQISSAQENLQYVMPGSSVTSELTLSNESANTTSRISLQTNSFHNHAKIKNPVTLFSDIPTRGTAQPKEFSQVEILPSAPCGDKIKFESIASSNQGLVKFKKSMYIGKPENVFIGNLEVNRDIPPDGTRGVLSPFYVEKHFPVSRVKVKVVFAHDVPTDLRYFISNSEDQEASLKMDVRKEGSLYKAESPFFDFYTRDAWGNWTLRVQDVEVFTTGELKNWDLWLTQSVCD